MKRKTSSYPSYNKNKGNTKITIAGNIIQVAEYEKVNHDPPKIRRINAIQWLNLETGEIFDRKAKTSRQDTVRRSISQLRDIINANTDTAENIRWCTLTYRENMTDTVRLMKDLEKFNKRLKFYLQGIGQADNEYITAIEPQGRGAWHAHILLIWQHKAPYISNDDFNKIWGNGFVCIKAVNNVDNIGAYLSAYMMDTLDEEGNSKKGERLHYYPPNMRYYRCSKGIKKPSVIWTTDGEAKRITQGLTITYETERILVIKDEPSSIKYTHYNRKPNPKARVKDGTSESQVNAAEIFSQKNV